MDRRVSGFLDDVAAWARAQADVRADALSDVDLALFVDDTEGYLR